MPRAHYLPPAPSLTVSHLSRAEIRSLAHTFGHHKRLASYRFCFLLPIVARDEIFLDDGCMDIYEWAAKFASMTRPEVDRILKLFDKIGKFDCLWALVGEGVGLSKLERVAPHANPENAAWLADRARHMTKPEVEELVRQIKHRSDSGQTVPASPRSGRPKTKPSAQASGSAGTGFAAPAQAPDPAQQSSTATTDAVRSITELLPAIEKVDSPAGSLQQDKTDPPSAPSGPETRDSTATEPDCGPGSNTEPMPARTTVRCTLELDPVGEKRVRELQDLYQRLHGRPIGLGQLLSLLARDAIARGELPSLESQESEDSGGADTSPSRHGTSRPATLPQAPKQFKPKILEVVVSIAETGWSFVRTALGWTPLPAGATTGFLSPTEAIPLANLRLAAIAAAEKPTGSRYRPVAIDRYLLARSGGYCEVAGCNRRAAAAHHTNRFAFDRSHHPDHLVCVCQLHHGFAQGGLFRNEADDPSGWVLIEQDEDPAVTPADRQFLACRGT